MRGDVQHGPAPHDAPGVHLAPGGPRACRPAQPTPRRAARGGSGSGLRSVTSTTEIREPLCRPPRFFEYDVVTTHPTTRVRLAGTGVGRRGDALRPPPGAARVLAVPGERPRASAVPVAKAGSRDPVEVAAARPSSPTRPPAAAASASFAATRSGPRASRRRTGPGTVASGSPPDGSAAVDRHRPSPRVWHPMTSRRDHVDAGGRGGPRCDGDRPGREVLAAQRTRPAGDGRHGGSSRAASADPGESLEEAAVRELDEELGCPRRA